MSSINYGPRRAPVCRMRISAFAAVSLRAIALEDFSSYRFRRFLCCCWMMIRLFVDFREAAIAPGHYLPRLARRGQMARVNAQRRPRREGDCHIISPRRRKAKPRRSPAARFSLRRQKMPGAPMRHHGRCRSCLLTRLRSIGGALPQAYFSVPEASPQVTLGTVAILDSSTP